MISEAAEELIHKLNARLGHSEAAVEYAAAACGLSHLEFYPRAARLMTPVRTDGPRQACWLCLPVDGAGAAVDPEPDAMIKNAEHRGERLSRRQDQRRWTRHGGQLLSLKVQQYSIKKRAEAERPDRKQEPELVRA